MSINRKVSMSKKDLTVGERMVIKALATRPDLTASEIMVVAGLKYKATLDRDLQFLQKTKYVQATTDASGAERFSVAAA
jgi:hypothetical protein